MAQLLGIFAPHPFVSALCNASVSSRAPFPTKLPKQQQVEREEHAYLAPDGRLYTLRGEPFVEKSKQGEHGRTSRRSSLQPEGKKFEGNVATAGVSASFVRKFLSKVRLGMTTADVCKNIVLPQTKQKQCSYATLIQSEPGTLGQANIFVSHAWGYDFISCMSVLLDYAAERPGEECFFWFDLFANNQWETQTMPQEFYATTFKSNIKNIGRVLLVLSPWDSPTPLTRAWCLWEIMCAIEATADLVVRLPKAQQEPFEKTLLSDSTKIISAMSKVQAQNAEAFFARDKEMIFGAISSGVGFSVLNQRVKEKMRGWLTDAAEGILQRAQQEGKASRALASIQQEVGSLLTQLGSLQRAEEILIKAVKFAKVEVNVAGSGGAHAARAYRLLGLCYRDKSELPAAKENLERALELYGEGEHEHQLDIASCLEGVAAVYRSEANYAKAFELYKRSLDLRLKVLGMNHVDTAASYDGMGGTCRMKGEFEDAVKYYKQGLSVRKALMGDRHPDVGASLNNLGNACFNLHQYQDALQYYSQCLPIFLEAFGEQHLNTTGCYNNMANAHQALGNHEAAGNNCRKALELSRQMFGDKSLHTAQAYSNLGGMMSAMDKLEEAETAFERSLEIATQAVGSEHPLIGDIEGGLGDVLANRGQLEQSLHHLKRSLQVRIKVLGPHHPSTAASHEALGQVYVKLKDPERAKEAFTASVDAKTHSLGAKHASTQAAQALLRSVTANARAQRREQEQPARAPAFQLNLKQMPSMTSVHAFQPSQAQVRSGASVHRQRPTPAFEPELSQMTSLEPSHAFQAMVSNIAPMSSHAFQPSQAQVRSGASVHRQRPTPAFEPELSQMTSLESSHAFQAMVSNIAPMSSHAFQPTLSQPAISSSLHSNAPAPPGLSAFQPSVSQMMPTSSHAFQPKESQMMSTSSHAFQPQVSQMMPTSSHAFQPPMMSTSSHAFQPQVSQMMPASSHAFQPMMSQMSSLSSHELEEPPPDRPSRDERVRAFQPELFERNGRRSVRSFQPTMSQMANTRGGVDNSDRPARRAFQPNNSNAIRSV